MITNSVQKSQEKHKIEEWASSADRSHPPSALCRNQGNKKICRQFSYWQWPNNKYEKLQSSYDLKKYCICWQCRCIDNLNRECWWFLYINVFASSLPRFRNCLKVEHDLALNIESTERPKRNDIQDRLITSNNFLYPPLSSILYFVKWILYEWLLVWV